MRYQKFKGTIIFGEDGMSIPIKGEALSHQLT